mgnify:CR=1 FL=1
MTTLSARKKAAIIEAAIELFQQNGFQGTSMDAIAAKAGASKRTVYNHFPSKQDLFETIAQSVWDTANEATSVSYDPTTPMREQLHKLAMKELVLVSDAEFLKLVRVLMAEFIHEPDMAQEIIERFNQEQSSLTLWMQQAGEHGQLMIKDPMEAGTQFHSLIKAQAFWPQIMFGQESMEPAQHDEFVQQVCTMFLAVYGV